MPHIASTALPPEYPSTCSPCSAAANQGMIRQKREILMNFPFFISALFLPKPHMPQLISFYYCTQSQNVLQ